MAVKIYNLCDVDTTGDRVHRAILPFSVSSVHSVANVEMIPAPAVF